MSRNTEEKLQPYLDKIIDSEEQIKDMKQNIQNVKGQIIKNQAQVQSLLMSVVASK